MTQIQTSLSLALSARPRQPSQPAAGFPALDSVTQAQVFVQALKQRPHARSSHFTIYRVSLVVADTADAAVPPRLGLVIPKRFLKHAVTRNRVKRVVREVFRLRQKALGTDDWIVRLFKLPPWHQKTASEFRHNCRAEIQSLLSVAFEKRAAELASKVVNAPVAGT